MIKKNKKHLLYIAISIIALIIVGLFTSNVIAAYFEMNISKIDSRIKTNELESQRLASLRDTLLPRLMSGEIKI